jgi:hypothetical protein
LSSAVVGGRVSRSALRVTVAPGVQPLPRATNDSPGRIRAVVCQKVCQTLASGARPGPREVS